MSGGSDVAEVDLQLGVSPPAPGVTEAETGGFAAGNGSTDRVPDERAAQDKASHPTTNIDKQVFIGVLNANQPGQKRIEAEKPSISKIDRPDLRRARALFVASRDFEAQHNEGLKLHDRNIWIVYGPEHAGKLTTAICWALRLRAAQRGHEALAEDEVPAEQVFCYRRSTRDSMALIDFMRSEDVQKDGVYILEDAFEGGLNPRELESPWLETLDRQLQEKKILLVLTTEWRLDDLESFNVGKIAAEVENLEKVFDLHLARFAGCSEAVEVKPPVRDLARTEWPRLQPFLRRPVQIERFCFKLGELEDEVQPEHLIQLAREAAYVGQKSVRSAFRELRANEKLYALLAVIFEGLERVMLEEIYDQAIRSLREAGVTTLRDARQSGLDDIMERIRAREDEQRVTFEDPDFELEALRQVKNYRHLLWSLSDVLLEICVEFRAPRYWALRRSIGAALGRLGAQEGRDLLPMLVILEQLARHSDGGVVAVAGYMLDQLCRDAPKLQDSVLELLERWVDSRDPDLMWAAGAAAWRVYDGIGQGRSSDRLRRAGGSEGEPPLDRLLRVIGSLVRHAGRFDGECRPGSREELEVWTGNNLRCAFYALVKLAAIHPSSLVTKLDEWLQGGSEDGLCTMAQLVAHEFFKGQIGSKLEPLPAREGEWLRLIGTVLALDPDPLEVGDLMMAALATWARWPEWWGDQVFASLLQTASRLTGKEGKALRSGLARHWLTSEEEGVRERGQNLLTRSQAMAGLPLRRAGHSRGLVLLDVSPEALGSPRMATLAQQLCGALAPYGGEVAIAQMGGTEISGRTGKPLVAHDLWPGYPRPRLALPPIDRYAARGGSSFIVLALARGPVLDWEEVLEQGWSSSLVLLTSEAETMDREGGPRRLPISFSDLDPVIAAAAAVLNAHVGAGASRPLDPVALQKVEEQLETWRQTLDRPANATGRRDPARRMVSLLLWLAGRDFGACLRIVRGWLEAERASASATPIGAAALRALCRFHDEQNPLPHASRLLLVRLIPLLADSDWGSAEVVLETLLVWAADREWTGMSAAWNESWTVLLSWIEKLIPHYRRELRLLLGRWKSRAAAREDWPQTVVQAIQRIEFRIALGSGEPLPALETGRRYGLLLLDASFADRPLRARLAELVNSLIDHTERERIATPLVVFRMGRRLPVAVPGERIEKGALFPSELGRLARLVGPMLEQLSPDQVQFVLILTAGPVLDADDWKDGAWASLIHLYGPPYASSDSEPFSRIPPPAALGEAESIARYLIQKGA